MCVCVSVEVVFKGSILLPVAEYSETKAVHFPYPSLGRDVEETLVFASSHSTEKHPLSQSIKQRKMSSILAFLFRNKCGAYCISLGVTLYAFSKQRDVVHVAMFCGAVL